MKDLFDFLTPETDTPAETSVKTSVETSQECLLVTPESTAEVELPPEETPIETPVETPVEILEETPVKAPTPAVATGYESKEDLLGTCLPPQTEPWGIEDLIDPVPPVQATGWTPPEEKRDFDWSTPESTAEVELPPYASEGWTPPDDLISYLLTLISPPDEKALYLEDLALIKWAEWAKRPDNSLCGLITRGTPTDEQSKELHRVLKPGAHLLLIAPDAEPWGSTGACSVEDSGFEIRDAIAIALPLDELAKLPSASTPPCHPFHYVPKADRGERELGCDALGGKSGAEAVGRKEGDAGTAHGAAGAGHGNSRIRNFHPTVKPVDLMVKILHDVPKTPEDFEVPTPTVDTKASDVLDPYMVLDPFLGSGSTGLACMETGHNFRGMEREEPYLEIATARAELWRSRLGAKKGSATLLGDEGSRPIIISDVGTTLLVTEEPQEEPELDVFF